MDRIDKILGRIRQMLMDLGFQKTALHGETTYQYKNLYCIPHFIQTLGYLIEYADSLEAAQKNQYEDGDVFPEEMDAEAILQGLEREVRLNMQDR